MIKPLSHSLIHTLEYGRGDLDQDLGEMLAECLDETEKRDVATSMTLKIEIKPLDRGQVQIRCVPSVKIPPEPRGSTTAWVTPEGNPSLVHPKQAALDLEEQGIPNLKDRRDQDGS